MDNWYSHHYKCITVQSIVLFPCFLPNITYKSPFTTTLQFPLLCIEAPTTFLRLQVLEYTSNWYKYWFLSYEYPLLESPITNSFPLYITEEWIAHGKGKSAIHEISFTCFETRSTQNIVLDGNKCFPTVLWQMMINSFLWIPEAIIWYAGSNRNNCFHL